MSQDLDRHFATATNAFADALWTSLPTDGNVFVSPLSINLALLLTANGAAEPSVQEIATALQLQQLGNIDNVNTAAQQLIGRLNQLTDRAASFVRIANSIWIAPTGRFRPEYAQLVASRLGAAAHQLTSIDQVRRGCAGSAVLCPHH